jgi:hypothetical protein
MVRHRRRENVDGAAAKFERFTITADAAHWSMVSAL